MNLPPYLLAMALSITTIKAAPWWIIAYQQDFCSTVTNGDTDINSEGSDSGVCHSLINPDASDHQCIIESYNNGVGTGSPCGTIPSGVLSAYYQDGQDNRQFSQYRQNWQRLTLALEGTGCTFWSNEDCTGTLQYFSDTSETDMCYEFDSIVRSFVC